MLVCSPLAEHALLSHLLLCIHPHNLKYCKPHIPSLLLYSAQYNISFLHDIILDVSILMGKMCMNVMKGPGMHALWRHLLLLGLAQSKPCEPS